MKLITNNHWHSFLYSHELTEKEKQDFDWMNQDMFDSCSFLRYRGRVYSTEDFMRMDYRDNNPFPDMWHGHFSDSYFSGVLIHISSCGECYKIATYIC